jgi:hypothetical protein
VWLECTSNISDFGVLGPFTENRNALLITDNGGGVLVPTPHSRSSENTVKSYSSVDLQEDGSGKTETTLIARGEYKRDWLHLKESTPDDQRSYMIDRLGLKSPGDPKVEENIHDKNLQIVINQQLDKIPELNAGSKMFLRPAVIYVWNVKMPRDADRKQNYYFACPVEKSDSTVIRMPKGYVIDDLPAPVSDSCKYGHFSCRTWYDAKSNAIITSSKLELTNYKIPASDYASVKRFFDAVLQNNDERVVIKKN